jgi:hypothetical protein
MYFNFNVFKYVLFMGKFKNVMMLLLNLFYHVHTTYMYLYP